MRTLVPNLITLLALCAGLTAIRLAAEGKLEWALGAIVFAAVLDGIDGRVARLLKGTSRFGAELDSLADFVNFGVAPGLTLYFWSLHELKSAGWIAAMVFAIAAGLRLARFNVMIDDPNRPAWAANFFVGMPAPAGAITVLLPVYMHFLGVPQLAIIPSGDVRLHPRHRLPDGVAAAGLFRQEARHPGAAGSGAAGLHRRRAVVRAADQLPLGGPDHRDGALSREPAVRVCCPIANTSAATRVRWRRARSRPARSRLGRVPDRPSSVVPFEPGADERERPTRH